MSILESIVARAREKAARVVMPEVEDPRILEAGKTLTSEGIAEVATLPDTPPTEAEIEAVRRIRPKTNPQVAARMLARPIFRAGTMVATGGAEALVAGTITPTKRVIEAASMTVGLADGVALPSSFFLMVMPDGRALILADCGFNVAPDAEGLAAIAITSARSAEALLGSARVAMLSFSTLTSGAGESVDRVAEATEMVRAAGVNVVGPVQGDAALNPGIATRKGIEMAEAANVLIFPSLDAGNIAYKLLQELGGAQALGPVLQGFARPVCDLSRGATVADIVAATAVSIALS